MSTSKECTCGILIVNIYDARTYTNTQIIRVRASFLRLGLSGPRPKALPPAWKAPPGFGFTVRWLLGVYVSKPGERLDSRVSHTVRPLYDLQTGNSTSCRTWLDMLRSKAGVAQPRPESRC